MPKKYFNYQTLDDLRSDAERLGVDLPLIEDPEEVKHWLARPVEAVGEEGQTWPIGNSLAIHPMEGCDGDLEGRPGELTFRRYRRFGSGGAKLIWFEACAVVPEGRANPRQLLIHPGYSWKDPLVGYRHPVLDAYPHVNLSNLRARGKPWKVASDDYLGRLEDHFVEAAHLAGEIGFDGVDIKMTHGYLLAELLSARSRQGRYGGLMLENRARIALDVLPRIRARVGRNFLLAVRLGVYDGVPYAISAADLHGFPRSYPTPYTWGFGTNPQDPLEVDLTEPLELVGMLKRSGLALLNVSLGNPYVNPHLGRPYEKPNEGLYEAPEHPLLGVARHFRVTEEIQRAYPDLAVVGTGYSWLQHFMINSGAANLRSGSVTLMGVGRGALAYPDFARDALTRGELAPLRTCKTLSFCTYLMRQKNHPLGQFPTGCPPYDKEGYGAIVKEARAAARKAASQAGGGH